MKFQTTCIALMKHHCLVWIFSFLALALATIATPSLAIDEQTPNGTIKLRYKVNIYGSNLGEIHTTIKKDQDKFEVSSVTRAEGVASLVLGGDLTQQCSFSAKDKQIVSEDSSIEKLGRSAFKNTVKIDWQSRFINYNDDPTLAIPNGYLVDSCNFQFAAAYTNHDLLKKNTIYVLDGKKSRLKAYVFKSSTQEKLKTPIGEFNTSKIVLERELNPDKSIIFWIAEEYPYFPLKMIEKRKSKKRIMTLKSYTKNS